ncbi:serine/arginine repetitive matrix protein 2-like isoform X1 [Rousettus aegyptiacus]|uniref:serine/arginine repetitive matrix protein 2-like isoform X1 n=1 Tax=Rousettus aegyptiacus TaxID=9407 RepID=UPI00168CFFE2|nr:serine/arginine repetitive matrix protein 2-like isoform X1 [Rousettus aegyptiacus]
MGGAGRRAGLAAAPALPRPGRRGRSVGAARPAHLAGSHPSARRGARRERGPGRRGRAALTRRTAEAPARRQSASRPAGARRASSAGDEPLAHPARNAAAAGRLHCLTAARAGVAARRCSDACVGTLGAGAARAEDLASREALSDVWEAQRHSDASRGAHTGPRPARSIAPSAARGAVQPFLQKGKV